MGKAYISHGVELTLKIQADARIVQRQTNIGETYTSADELTSEAEYEHL